MSGEIEQGICDFCKEVGPVTRTYLYPSRYVKPSSNKDYLSLHNQGDYFIIVKTCEPCGTPTTEPAIQGVTTSEFVEEQPHEVAKSSHEDFQEKVAAIPNLELVEIADMWLSKLCKTGATAFTMTVPPRLGDTDIVFAELIRRFKFGISIHVDPNASRPEPEFVCPGLEMIIKERHEQVFKHGRTINYDVSHNRDGQLLDAIMMLTAHLDFVRNDWNLKNFNPPTPKGWETKECDKMRTKTNIEILAIIGSLAGAEIARLKELYKSSN